MAVVNKKDAGMTQQKPTSDKFDEYLRQLEARERGQRRKKLLMILPLTIITGILVWQYFSISTPTPPSSVAPPQTFQARELSPAKVEDIFKIDNAEFVLNHPLLGTDTIRSAAEYTSLIRLAEQVQEDRLAVDTAQAAGDSIRIAAKGTLDVFTVDVAGERRVGQPLVFTVENYDPEVRYVLDFGNGIRRKIRERTAYTYPLPGHFVMQLIASDPARGASVYTKKYEIKASASEEFN